MKKLLIPILLIATIISCEKTGDLKFSEAIPGGCALEKGASPKSVKAPGTNKVSFTINDGNLDLFVGFNATCCGQYSANSDIKGDSIIVKIITTQIGMCNCICYYTYNFKFIGTGANYKYRVTVDNDLTFTGKIDP